MTRLALTLLALLAASPSLAQDGANYPDNPVRIVVPFPAGSATDSSSKRLLRSESTRMSMRRE